MKEETQQNTLEWYKERIGRITGSAVGNIMGKGRGSEFTKTGLTYLTEVAAERLLSPAILEDTDLFAQYIDEVSATSKAMRIGHMREAEAAELYERTTGNHPTECGCIPHGMVEGFASSPDRLIIEERTGIVKGVLEIKCPKPATFMEYLTSVSDAETLKGVNANYYWQCQAHMSVTGAEWCDFCVYCPWLTSPLHVVRIRRDGAVIRALEERVLLALDHVDRLAHKS